MDHTVLPDITVPDLTFKVTITLPRHSPDCLMPDGVASALERAAVAKAGEVTSMWLAARAEIVLKGIRAPEWCQALAIATGVVRDAIGWNEPFSKASALVELDEDPVRPQPDGPS